jgi:putative transposase
MKRGSSPQVAQRHAGLLQRLREPKADHPFWGYRSIWADLRFVAGWVINQKRMLRLMREHHLLVRPYLRLKAKRTPSGTQPRPTRPNEWWGIDMTKVLAEGFGWVSIVLVLDWYTQKIVGHDAGSPCTAQPWLSALDMVMNGQCPDGARGHDVSLMSDNGCQPTAQAFMAACSTLGIHQGFTSDNNPKGKAATARVMRTLKEECLWLQEWTCPST